MAKCIARRFVENGHKVIATGRRHERLQALKDELGENVTAQLDVRNRAAIEEMMALCLRNWRDIDVLVKITPVWRWVLNRRIKPT